MNRRRLSSRGKKIFSVVAGVALLGLLPVPALWSHETDHADHHRNIHLQVRLGIEAPQANTLKKAWVGSYSLELLPCAPRISWWQRLSPVPAAYANHGESFTTPLQWKLARYHDLTASHQETLVDTTIPAGQYCSMMLTWGHPQLKPGDQYYSPEVGRYSFQLETAQGETRQAMNAFSQLIQLPQPIGDNEQEQIGLQLNMDSVLRKVDWQKSTSHFMSDWFRQLGNELEVQV